jgi:hypothetical protein
MAELSGGLRERVLRYLAAHHVMTLATTGPEGPWAAAVFYASEDFTLYFLSAPGSRHGRNMAAQPRVAATIQEDYPDWPEIQGIQLEGEVSLIEGAEKAEAMRLYGLKFPVVADSARMPPEIARALDRVAWYELVPARLYFIDNSRGFGHRDELPLGPSPNG